MTTAEMVMKMTVCLWHLQRQVLMPIHTCACSNIQMPVYLHIHRQKHVNIGQYTAYMVNERTDI